jgi:hypothetical protein
MKPGGAVAGWVGTLRVKMHELELIASWASQVQLGTVRDYCRKAIADLKYQEERFIELCEEYEAERGE